MPTVLMRWTWACTIRRALRIIHHRWPRMTPVVPVQQPPEDHGTAHPTLTTPGASEPATASKAAGLRSKSLPVHLSGPRSSTGTVTVPAGPLRRTREPQGSESEAVHALTHHGTGAPSQVAGRSGYQEARAVDAGLSRLSGPLDLPRSRGGKLPAVPLEARAPSRSPADSTPREGLGGTRSARTGPCSAPPGVGVDTTGSGIAGGGNLGTSTDSAEVRIARSVISPAPSGYPCIPVPGQS